MTINVDLGDVWSHYCTLNQTVKWSTRAVSDYTEGDREVVY
jgi:hypothetical protein